MNIAKIKRDKVELLKALRDIAHEKREADDVDRREDRQLKIICKEIDNWIDEMEKAPKKKKEIYEFSDLNA